MEQISFHNNFTNAEINDIPKKIHKNLEIVKAKITDPNYADYRKRYEWVADLMKFVSHFEGPDKGNLTTPPEEIDYSTVFETGRFEHRTQKVN